MTGSTLPTLRLVARGRTASPRPHRRPGAWIGLGWLLLGWALLPAEPASSLSSPAASPEDQRIARSTADYWSLATINSDVDLPFDFECDVLYYNPLWQILWIQTGAAGEYAAPGANPLPMASGDRVRVRGLARAPVGELTLLDATIEVIGRSSAVATPVTTAELKGTRYRNSLVSLEAWVDKQDRTDDHHVRLTLSDRGEVLTAVVSLDNVDAARGLVDRRIRVTGVFAPRIDPSGRLAELQLMVAGLDQIELLGFISNDPRFEVPRHQISELATLPVGTTLRLSGETVQQEIGKTLTLRDASGQLTLAAAQLRYLSPRQPVEVLGTLATDGINPTLTQVSFRPLDIGHLPADADPGVARQLLNLAARVRELPEAETQTGHIATLRGVVTWSEPDSTALFMQDSSGGIELVLAPGAIRDPPGAMIDARGVVVAGNFAPVVRVSQTVRSGVLRYPEPIIVNLEQALSGTVDAQWVEMRGYVYAVNREDDSLVNRLRLSTDHGDFVVRMPSDRVRRDLLHSVISLRGVCRTVANAERQLQGVELWAPDETLVQVIDIAPSDPFTLPELPLVRLGRFNPSPNHSSFVKVSGTVLHHRGEWLYLADGGQVLRVHTRDTEPQPRGRRIEAAGRLGRLEGAAVLREALLRPLGQGDLPPVRDLADAGAILSPLEGHLVHARGRLINVLQTPSTLRLSLQTSTGVIDAEMPLNPRQPSLRPVVPAFGAEVGVTGVLVPADTNAALASGFRLSLDQPGDITVLRAAPWWNPRRLGAFVGSLVLAIGLGILWVRVLRRRVRQQTNQIKQQLDRERQLFEKLERATRLESLGLLAGGIAHDFNNLLTVVLGNLSLLRLNASAGSDADQSLADAERAVGRARQLTLQLLTFAKGGNPVRSATDLPGVIREVTDFSLHGSAVRRHLHLAADAWPAHVDKGQIGQVVQNLVLNALQAMPDGGHLRVRLANVRTSDDLPATLPAGRYLRLEIADTGCGIAEENLPRIFDPYYSTKPEGHGLGLATVYSIVRKHHGEIEVQSTLHRGTTFRIWLPAAVEGAATAATAPESGDTPAAGQGQPILIMDDESDIRDLAVRMLLTLGYTPTAVADGRAALASFQQAREAGRPFAAAVLDLTICGGMGGLETLRRLRQLDPGLPVIVSSGYSDDKAVAAPAEHGFDGLIPKPYEVRTFARVLRQVLAATAPV